MLDKKEPDNNFTLYINIRDMIFAWLEWHIASR